MLKYSGGFKAEVGYFKGIDNAVIGYLKEITAALGEFDQAWRDVDSKPFLDSCNKALEDAYTKLNTAHVQIAEYFTGIQGILNQLGGFGTFELPDLEAVEYSPITAFDDTVVFDDQKVPGIVSKMRTAARNICSDVEEFDPYPTSFTGSSDDVIEKIKDNLSKAAKCYQVLEGPANAILTEVDKVLESYNNRISALK